MTASSSATRISKRRRISPRLIAAAAVAAVIIAIIVFALSGKDEASASASKVATASRGPLLVLYPEQGELKAERSKIIANEVGLPAIIKQVAPHGALVKKGEVIIQFECEELLERIAQQELTVTSAQNDLIQATENLELKKREVDYNIQKAERTLVDAENALQRYIEGEWDQKRGNFESELALAQRRLKLAQDKLDFKLKANEMPELQMPYSKNDIEADTLEVQSLELAVTKSKASLNMLIQYDDPGERRKLAAAVDDARLSLEKARIEKKTQLMVHEQSVKTRTFALSTHQQRMKELQDSCEKLVVTGEESGLVLYDTGRAWWLNIVVEVGAKINPRQQVIVQPDLSTLQVVTRVSESYYSQVKPGTPARVRVDALPDRVLMGKVASVSPQPEQPDRRMNPNVKFFGVKIDLDEPPQTLGLKPNMNAQVELELAALDNVLQVPSAAVFVEQERSFCYLRNPAGRVERRTVKVGKMSNERIEILEGLVEGDEVLLVSPTDDPAAPADKNEAPQPRPQPMPDGAQ